MLPLGFVLFAAAETGSTATAGVLVAAFTVASALAPVRGRIVDRHGPPALAAFAVVVLGRHRRARGGGDRGRPARRAGAHQRRSRASSCRRSARSRARSGDSRCASAATSCSAPTALDSAGEEAALIVAPLLVALVVAIASPALALVVAAVGLLAGTIGAGRSGLAARVALTRERAPRRAPLPAALWLVIASLVPTAAALGAVDVAVPAAAREHGSLAAAGVLLAGMAAGSVAGSLLAGRSGVELAGAARARPAAVDGRRARERGARGGAARTAGRGAAASRRGARRAVRDAVPARRSACTRRSGHTHVRVAGHREQRGNWRRGCAWGRA